MKHIAMLVPSFPVPSETFIVTEIRALIKEGHKVTIITFEDLRDKNPLVEDWPVIEVKRPAITNALGLFMKPIQFSKGFDAASKMSSVSNMSLMVYGNYIADILKREKIDHLHCQFMHAPSAYGIVAAKMANIRVSAIGHGHDIYVNRADVSAKIELCDFTVAVCQEMCNEFENLVEGKARLLHCGIDFKRFNNYSTTAKEGVNLLFIGRLVEKKGLHFLLPAIKQLSTKTPVTLDIVGDGEMRQDLEFLAESLGISWQVNFLGAKSPVWLNDNLPQYSALIAPFCEAENGDKDTGALVVKEAMACGLPVLTTDFMGCKEMVNGHVGLKCKPNDVVSIKSMIELFCYFTPHQRFIMGQNAMSHAKHLYDASKQAKTFSGWVEGLSQ